MGEDGGVNPSPLDDPIDDVLASAVDLARSAVLEVASADEVGEHVEAAAEGDLLVTHYFQSRAAGYRGWRWAATLVRLEGSDAVTVDEVVLLPGQDALLAPEWLPWSDRVRAGDLGPGDLHPTSPEDPRLEPGYTGTDALEAADDPQAPAAVSAPLRPEQWQLGLGRERVLSALGRDIAAERWYDGDFGPFSPMAKAAPGQCTDCGFLLRIGGALGQAFGVCANELGADGRVVALGYGCGAHSSVRALEGTGVPVTDIVVDDYRYLPLDVERAASGHAGIDQVEADALAVIADLAAEVEHGALEPEVLSEEDIVASIDPDTLPLDLVEDIVIIDLDDDGPVPLDADADLDPDDHEDDDADDDDADDDEDDTDEDEDDDDAEDDDEDDDDSDDDDEDDEDSDDDEIDDIEPDEVFV